MEGGAPLTFCPPLRHSYLPLSRFPARQSHGPHAGLVAVAAPLLPLLTVLYKCWLVRAAAPCPPVPLSLPPRFRSLFFEPLGRSPPAALAPRCQQLSMYTGLAFRENVLRLNGSNIRAWWIWHHYYAIALCLTMLTMRPEDPACEARGRGPYLVFFLAFAQKGPR